MTEPENKSTLLETLYQDEVWGRDNIKLEELDTEHLDNIINYLYRTAETLKDTEDRPLSMSAKQWIEETPLMSKLLDLQSRRPRVGWL